MGAAQVGTQVLGTVGLLRRHPVKSVGGEDRPHVDVVTRGVLGDREWAVICPDGGIGSGKTSTRFRKVDGLLHWAAQIDEDGGRWLVAPDGTRTPVGDPGTDAALSAAFDRPLRLLPEAATPYFDDSPLHLVTTSSLAAAAQLAGGPVDPRRTRANVVVDTGDDPGWPEDGWLGRTVTLGPDVRLRVEAPMTRCVMVDAEHRDVPRGPKLLAPLGRGHETVLGVQAWVDAPGRVRLGDPVALV